MDKSLKRLFDHIVNDAGSYPSNDPAHDEQIMKDTPHVTKFKMELFNNGKGKVVGNSYPSEPMEW